MLGVTSMVHACLYANKGARGRNHSEPCRSMGMGLVGDGSRFDWQKGMCWTVWVVLGVTWVRGPLVRENGWLVHGARPCKVKRGNSQSQRPCGWKPAREVGQQEAWVQGQQSVRLARSWANRPRLRLELTAYCVGPDLGLISGLL